MSDENNNPDNMQNQLETAENGLDNLSEQISHQGNIMEDILNNNKHFDGSFPNLDQFNELQNILEFPDNGQLQYNFLFSDDNHQMFQGMELQSLGNEMYFHNTLNKAQDDYNINEEFKKQNQYNQSLKPQNAQQMFDNYASNAQDDSKMDVNRNNQDINRNDLEVNRTNLEINRNNFCSDKGQTNNYVFSDQDKNQINQQTQKVNMKQVEEYILNHIELSKKYKKKIACPNCKKANLDMFEINYLESIFMCTNNQCSFPLEDEELTEYTFQTKFKKRSIIKIKNKIHFKFNPSVEIIFEDQDVSTAIKYLELSTTK